ncbi:MAG: hypothetical protein IJC33_06355 [Clostridia bacterium]|nr:hypothetical protein [Clostridia bacterium]
MEGIVRIIALAIIVEGLVEYGKSIGKAFAGDDRKMAITQLGAVVGGVVVSVAAGADLFAALGIHFVWPWLGVALTGIVISRGANYVSDFVGRLHKGKESA